MNLVTEKKEKKTKKMKFKQIDLLKSPSKYVWCSKFVAKGSFQEMSSVNPVNKIIYVEKSLAPDFNTLAYRKGNNNIILNFEKQDKIQNEF